MRSGGTLVGCSGIGIYGMRRDDHALDEDAEHGKDVLAEICQAWEQAAAEASALGARVAIARIGIVLGDGGALSKMTTPFRFFVGGPLGDGSQWVSWVHIEDAVRAIVFAIDTASFAGPFNVVAPSPVTARDFARALGRALHRPSAFPVPAFALRLMLGERAEAVLTGQRVVARKLQAAGFRFGFPGLEQALENIFGARHPTR
jgi:uncharacterized protein (TIGR01777 family)